MPSFKVTKSDGFTWEGKHYSRGATIDIPEGHPRLDMMKNAGYIQYNAGDPTPTPDPKPAPGPAPSGGGQPVAQKSKSRRRR